MALDAQVGNRAKENYSLTVDYSSIYKTSNEAEIRKVLSLECCIIDWFESLKDTEKDKIKEKIDVFKGFSDRELAKQRTKKSEVLKQMFKPTYELKNYNIADDNSIGGLIINNKDKKTENFLIVMKDGEMIRTYMDKLIDLFTEKNSKVKKDHKGIAKLRKEIEILGQVEEKEQLNKKL